MALDHRRSNVITKSTSGYLGVNIGVPQRFILGPVLFLLYIDDITKMFNSGEVAVTMYADDTSFLVSARNDTSLRVECSEVVEKAVGWFCRNSLHLNFDKTSYIRFHPYQKRTTGLQIGTERWSIAPAESIKFLVLYLDEHLDFKNHCSNLISKIHGACFLF